MLCDEFLVVISIYKFLNHWAWSQRMYELIGKCQQNYIT